MSGALYTTYNTNAALLIPVIVALMSVLAVLIGLKAYEPWFEWWREVERRMVRWVHGQRRAWRSDYDPARAICDDIEDEEIEDAWMTAEELVERIERRVARHKARGLFPRPPWPSAPPFTTGGGHRGRAARAADAGTCRGLCCRCWWWWREWRRRGVCARREHS